MTMSVYLSRSYNKKSIFKEQASSLRSTTSSFGSNISSIQHHVSGIRYTIWYYLNLYLFKLLICIPIVFLIHVCNSCTQASINSLIVNYLYFYTGKHKWVEIFFLGSITKLILWYTYNIWQSFLYKRFYWF